MTAFDPRESIARSGYGEAFAERYDAFRPSPPEELCDVLLQLAGVKRAGCVVDLGSGTGLSSWPWVARARDVIGVEPNDAMRAVAERTGARRGPAVRFVGRFAHETGLPDASADVVTCAQSLHWMEPEPTLREVARILRRGGVFAAFDYSWPPVIHPELERAFDEVYRRVYALHQKGEVEGPQAWDRRQHAARMRESGHFRHVREFSMHGRELGDAKRFVGSTLSQSHVSRPLERGISESELGVDELRAVAERVLGDGGLPWTWSYAVHAGVK